MRCLALALAFLVAVPPTVRAAEPLSSRAPDLAVAYTTAPEVRTEPVVQPAPMEANAEHSAKPMSLSTKIAAWFAAALLLFIILHGSAGPRSATPSPL